jgi:hypothetical protein
VNLISLKREKDQVNPLNSNLFLFFQEKDWLVCVHITQPGILFGIPKSARCVQRLNDSLNSAIHINFHTLLCSSSMWEPRDPLLKVVFLFFQPNVFLSGKHFPPKKPLTIVAIVCLYIYAAKRHIYIWVKFPLMIPPQVHLRRPCYDFYFL